LTCQNGLTAVVDSRPSSRTVFIQVAVRVGSRDEPAGLAGISHLLEHLLFKEGHGQTGRRNPAFSALRTSGGLVNASTDFELTEYHADLPAGRFSAGWDAVVSMITGIDFGEEEIARERLVVLQEAAMGKSDPLAIAAYSVLSRIFPGDPIGQPVIGFRRTLKNVALDDLRRHFSRYYTPAGMFAVIVGDVDPVEAADRVAATLCALPPARETRAAYPHPAPRIEPMYRFRTLVKQSYLLAGSLTDGEADPDAVAMEMLATILGDGRTSRLHRRLVVEEALTDEVLALTLQMSNTGAMAAGLAVDPDRAERARTALIEEIVRLAKEPVPAPELETAKARLHARLAMLYETNEGIARFRSRRVYLGQSASRDAYLSSADQLTPSDLLRVASSHWGEAPGRDASRGGLIEVQVLPARGFGKVLAALKFLLFRRL